MKILTDSRISVMLMKGQRKTLTLSKEMPSSAHLVNNLYQILYLRLEKFVRNQMFKHFPIYKQSIPKLTLLEIRSRTMKGHHFKMFRRT